MKTKLLILFATLCFSGSSLIANEVLEPQNHVAVGSRILSEEERASLASEREMYETLEAESLKAEGKDVPVKKSPAYKEFYALHYASFHRPIAAAYDGSTLELEDGSIWSLKYYSDWSLILSWLPRDSIVIERVGYHGLEYKIINQTANQWVIAMPYLGPSYLGNHTHWVVERDPFWGTVRLEDGSEWTPYFSSDTKNWLPNDTVILGSYDSISSYNTILINVSLVDCVRAKLNNQKN